MHNFFKENKIHEMEERDIQILFQKRERVGGKGKGGASNLGLINLNNGINKQLIMENLKGLPTKKVGEGPKEHTKQKSTK